MTRLLVVANVNFSDSEAWIVALAEGGSETRSGAIPCPPVISGRPR